MRELAAISQVSLGTASKVIRALEERPAEELTGLVYSLTLKPDDSGQVWYNKPAVLAVIVLSATLLLNIIFF